MSLIEHVAIVRREASDRVRHWNLKRKVEMQAGVHVAGPVVVLGRGRIRIGAGARIGSPVGAIELRAFPGAEIVIGEGAIIEGGCSIEATKLIIIGAGARIGAFSRISDCHLHSVVGPRSQRPPSVPVTIGDGAWVGPRAVLLPGANLGARSRVATATVVSKRVAEGMEIAGAPPVLAKRTS